VNLLLLHGAAGIWDEVACLVIPATVIMGVALAVLREKPSEDADGETDVQDAVGASDASIGADAERGEEVR
jgi:hypothetical protein